MRILTINPGSTSTKVVLFVADQVEREVEIQHDKADLAGFVRVIHQLPFRLAAVRQALGIAGAPDGQMAFVAEDGGSCMSGTSEGGGGLVASDAGGGPDAKRCGGFDTAEDGGGPKVQESGGLGVLDAVVGRGGLLAPLPGGTYAVDEQMLDDLRSARHGEHSSNLGALMAVEFATASGCPAYVVDPIVTDELAPVARVTGLPEVERRSIFHALSQRGAAREAARRLCVRYEDENFIVAHLGGGISIGAHSRGRVVDVVNALDGEGPFSPERSGSIPVQSLLALIEKGTYTPADLRRTALTRSGLFGLLGVNDLRQVEAMIDGGDERAALVFSALVYNVAKYVASLAPVFGCADVSGRSGTPGPGDVLPLRAVVLTGGMARSARLAEAVTARVAFLAPVVVVTGLEEMAVMAEGAARVLRGEAAVLHYRP